MLQIKLQLYIEPNIRSFRDSKKLLKSTKTLPTSDDAIEVEDFGVTSATRHENRRTAPISLVLSHERL